METNCLTYKELAAFLKLSESTVKQNWRYYPHFFITPKSKESNNLKGARFNLDDVFTHLKENSQNKFSLLTSNPTKHRLKEKKEKNNVNTKEELTYDIFDFKD